MTQAEDLIRYMLLQYVGSLDFISGRLSKVKSTLDLESMGSFIVPESILAFGFKTGLKYPDISSPVWRQISSSDIFVIAVDSLFGEKVTFDIDKYRERVGEICSQSESYALINKLIENFGQDGFENALKLVAVSHKWERIAPKVEFKDAPEEIRTRSIQSLNQTEIEEIISEISKVKIYVDESSLSQSDKAQASMLASSALTLAQAPSPPWHVIKEILILLGAISTTLAFVIPIASKIL